MTYTTKLGSDNNHFILWVTQRYIVIQYRQSPPPFCCMFGVLFLLYLNKTICGNIGHRAR
ncbi:MAG: hypothetical protein ACI8XG_001290 [Congregibacter sp.]|jgi:hypothetical protein